MINNKADNLVYTELRENIEKGSKLSVISGYFTMYAYYEMRDELEEIDNMRLFLHNLHF